MNKGGTLAEGVLGGPHGIGTQAARITSSLLATAPQRLRRHAHVPFQRVGPTPLPEFRMPFPLRLNRHLAGARERNVEWSDRMGITGEGIWDRSVLDAADLALCAAGIHPEATPGALDLSTQWLTWGTYADDYYPVVFGRRNDLAGAKACNDRLSAFLPVDLGATPVPVNAMERGLADLWRRTAGPMSEDARRAFRAAIDEMTESWLWELGNSAVHRVPDPVDYVEMRRRTFGSNLTMSLSRLAHLRAVPADVLRSTPVAAMENSAADYAALLNDVVSYQKEMQFEGELHNAVLVVQNFLGCVRDRAVEVVNGLITERMRQFEHIVAAELPAMCTDFDLDQDTRTALLRHARELQDWMAGVLNWHLNVGRYTEAELRRRAAPAGIGRSASRLDLISMTPQTLTAPPASSIHRGISPSHP
jgi:germacradienol/geosmin synthase